MSDSFLCICSCCGVLFNHTDEDASNFVCCVYSYCPLSDYPYWSCSNCVCIIHLEEWDYHSEEQKVKRRNEVLIKFRNPPIKYCCLKRASLCYLAEYKKTNNNNN